MKYKIKLYIGGHLSMVTYRTDTMQNVLSCARKAITMFQSVTNASKFAFLTVTETELCHTSPETSRNQFTQLLTM